MGLRYTESMSSLPLDGAASTERLLIEPLTPEHAPLLFHALDDDRIYRYVPTPHASSIGELQDYFGKLAAGPGEDRSQIWRNWALRLSASGVYIGTLQATVLADRDAWIGYMISSAFWGHGYASEAVAWLIAELVRHAGVSSMRASVDLRNRRSSRLLRRMGFRKESTESSELHGQPTTDGHYRLAVGPEAAGPTE
jgi:RimJ/RimL family protein N-acetyltransferase